MKLSVRLVESDFQLNCKGNMSRVIGEARKSAYKSREKEKDESEVEEKSYTFDDSSVKKYSIGTQLKAVPRPEGAKICENFSHFKPTLTFQVATHVRTNGTLMGCCLVSTRWFCLEVVSKISSLGLLLGWKTVGGRWTSRKSRRLCYWL